MTEKFVLVTFGRQLGFFNQETALWQKQALELEELLQKQGFAVLDETSLDQIEPGSFIFIAGCLTCKDFYKKCLPLLERSAGVCMVLDAMQYRKEILPTLANFTDHDIQLTVLGSVRTLLQAKRHVRSAFPKADNSVTCAIFVDVDTDDPRVLTFMGTKEIEAGHLLLPGGFLIPFVETLKQGCSRETMEECFFNRNATGEHDKFTYLIDPDVLELIDERSCVWRDERGHVIDHGYAWFVPKEVQDKVIAAVSGGDEVVGDTAAFRQVSQVLTAKIAYDHRDLIVAGLKRLSEKKILSQFSTVLSNK